MGQRSRMPSLGAVLTAALLVACGGVTAEPDGSGGGIASGDGGASAGSGGGSGAANGGAHASTGGVPPSTGGRAGSPLPDCTNPVAGGTACSVTGARCGGPCSNSWQAENVCNNGIWDYLDVVACGPDASHAPSCKNSFSGGQPTPCCPNGKLDCAGKPDGYPGFGCTPGDGSFCSCVCQGGAQICGC